MFLLCFMCQFNCRAENEKPVLYATAQISTPVLNTSDFASVFGGKSGTVLKTDKSGLVRETEFIALPGTVFKIHDVIDKKVGSRLYRVTTEEYPYTTRKGYFVDSRFVILSKAKPMSRDRSLPPEEMIISNLLSAVGGEYVWGGNRKDGVDEMLIFYPPSISLDESKRNKWMLKGVDCSGLLYEATNGFTPRNTSSLIHFGEAVDVEGLLVDAIVRKTRPLDLIVWKGHAIIVLDKASVIESRLDYNSKRVGNQGGVRVRGLREVLAELLIKRIPVNDYENKKYINKKRFVVRKWYKV
jgi:hypothetical protein